MLQTKYLNGRIDRNFDYFRNYVLLNGIMANGFTSKKELDRYFETKKFDFQKWCQQFLMQLKLRSSLPLEDFWL